MPGRSSRERRSADTCAPAKGSRYVSGRFIPLHLRDQTEQPCPLVVAERHPHFAVGVLKNSLTHGLAPFFNKQATREELRFFAVVRAAPERA
jgi:hypothetical protein